MFSWGAFIALVGLVGSCMTIYEFIKARTRHSAGSGQLAIVFGSLTMVLIVVSIIFANILSPPQNTGSSTNPAQTSGNSAPGTAIAPVQATPTPTPTPVPIHNKKLSLDMLLDHTGAIYFLDPPKDVVVNNRLLQADIALLTGSFSFKLDRQQKSLQLECGLSNDEPQGDTYQLKVLGDNQELLSQVYTAGGDAIAKEVGIQGVQILTLVLTGTYGNPAFYCKDQLLY